MTRHFLDLGEFEVFLRTAVHTTYIVRIWADGNEFNEVLVPDETDGFDWLHDWYEGQMLIYILGIVPLSDVNVPEVVVNEEVEVIDKGEN